jgi:hypothetical protein
LKHGRGTIGDSPNSPLSRNLMVLEILKMTVIYYLLINKALNFYIKALIYGISPAGDREVAQPKKITA